MAKIRKWPWLLVLAVSLISIFSQGCSVAVYDPYRYPYREYYYTPVDIYSPPPPVIYSLPPPVIYSLPPPVLYYPGFHYHHRHHRR